MKRILAILMAGAVLAGGPVVYAGGSCCPAGKEAKTEAKADKAAACGDVFAKLNLTEDQKKKLADLKTECDKGGCTEESRAKYLKGVKEILTAEQLAQCKAECEKTAKGGCPMAAKADSKI